MTDNLTSPQETPCKTCAQQECVCPTNMRTFGRWRIEWYNQWTAILNPRTHNWIDWRLVLFAIQGEESPYKASRELEIGLLGFSIIITYCWYERETDDDFPC